VLYPQESYWGEKFSYPNLPMYQQFIWLDAIDPSNYPFSRIASPRFLFYWDRHVLILGLLGFPFLYKRNKIYALWYLSTALFLLLYPLKNIHFTLIFIPPLTLAVGELTKFHIKMAYKYLKRSISTKLILRGREEKGGSEDN